MSFGAPSSSTASSAAAWRPLRGGLTTIEIERGQLAAQFLDLGRGVAGKESAVADAVAPGILLGGDDTGFVVIDAPHLARAMGKIERDRPDTAVKIEDVFFAGQLRQFDHPVVKLLRGMRIGLGKHPGGIDQFEPADLLQERLTSRQHAIDLAPDHVAAIFVDVEDHAGNKGKLALQRPRQLLALGQAPDGGSPK